MVFNVCLFALLLKEESGSGMVVSSAHACTLRRVLDFDALAMGASGAQEPNKSSGGQKSPLRQVPMRPDNGSTMSILVNRRHKRCHFAMVCNCDAQIAFDLDAKRSMPKAFDS